MPITYAWEKLKPLEVDKKEVGKNLETKFELVPLETCASATWCIAFKFLNGETLTEHDGAMAYELGLEYQEYTEKTINNGGELYKYKMVFAEDDVHHTTDSRFKTKDDAWEAIKEIHRFRKEKLEIVQEVNQ
ncbi:hypothetical protein ACU3L3_07345 [Priestia endophytica]